MNGAYQLSKLKCLLIDAAKDFLISPDYISSLPLARTEGSLKRRFKAKSYNDLAKRLRAKTGTLTKPVSVTAIAGYLQHPSHGLLAFSIIQNGIKAKSQPNIVELRAKQEKIIYDIYKK